MRIALAIACAALGAQTGFGYIRLGYTEATGTFVPLSRMDAAAIQYYVNDQVKAGQNSSATGSQVKVVKAGSDPVAAIQAALATWGSVPGAGVRFLPLKTTSAAHSASDGKMTITFASADDLSLLGYVAGKSAGAIAVTANTWGVEKGQLADGTQVDKGSIVDSDIILNPSLTFSTDGSTQYDLQAVVTHELGHALGANHTGLLGATMFPFSAVGTQAVLDQRLLSSDEVTFAGSAYPAGGSSLGTISGHVKMADGSAVKSGLLTLIDRAGGNTLGAITGPDGRWSLRVPAGNYIVYAEPFNGIVGAGNIISLDSSQVSAGFQPTMIGGATPTEIGVAADGTAIAPDLVVAPSSNGLTVPFSALGTAGASGDVRNLSTQTGPAIISSGQSFDVAFAGGGVDATTNIQVLGGGMTIHAGSLRVDKSVSFSVGPLLRATVDIAARSTPSLGTLMITKGASAVALSGLYVVVPPRPTFTSASVVNAASFEGSGGSQGAVSPGGIYTVFSQAQSANLGPVAAAQATSYDAYGKLPTLLGGVSVTFDGMLAPLFYSSGGQLNLQAPFDLAGKSSTSVQVSYNGSASDVITVPVLQSQPAFFGYPGGTIVVNSNNALNVASAPASRGDYVTFYGTGIGTPVGYSIETGKASPVAPAGYSGNSTCTLNGAKTVPVAYAGWTPTSAGLAQWTVILPTDAPTGNVSVKCTDPHGATTGAGILFIK